jgi:hypothetical protein
LTAVAAAAARSAIAAEGARGARPSVRRIARERVLLEYEWGRGIDRATVARSSRAAGLTNATLAAGPAVSAWAGMSAAAR